MSHSLRDYLRRRSTDALDIILNDGNTEESAESCSDALLDTVLVIHERGAAVPTEVRKHAADVWQILKNICPGLGDLYPELEEL